MRISLDKFEQAYTGHLACLPEKDFYNFIILSFEKIFTIYITSSELFCY